MDGDAPGKFPSPNTRRDRAGHRTGGWRVFTRRIPAGAQQGAFPLLCGGGGGSGVCPYSALAPCPVPVAIAAGVIVRASATAAAGRSTEARRMAIHHCTLHIAHCTLLIEKKSPPPNDREFGGGDFLVKQDA
jgi:hypothetical protein